MICAETEAEVEDRIGWVREHYRPHVEESRLEGIEATARKMAGTPDQLVDRFTEWQQVGLGYAIAYFPDLAYDRAGLELFAAEVMPALGQSSNSEGR